MKETGHYHYVTVGTDGCIRSYTTDYKSLIIDDRKIMDIRPGVTQCTYKGLRRQVCEISMTSGEKHEVVGSVDELRDRLMPRDEEDAQ